MISCAEDGNLDVPSSVIEARLASMPEVPDEEWTIRGAPAPSFVTPVQGPKECSGLGERLTLLKVKEKVVGAPRFELGTSWSRTKRATRLRYAPTKGFRLRVTGYRKTKDRRPSP